MIAAALALAAMVGVTPMDAEYQGTRHVVRQFEAQKRDPPAGDPVLTRVSRRLAEDALRGTAAGAADLVNIWRAMSNEGSWDPPPRALIVQGSPAELMLQSLLARGGFADSAATHLGVGSATEGERAAMAVLLTVRRVELAPFPRRLPFDGRPRRLCGTLRPGFTAPQVFVTFPSGEVRHLPLGDHRGAVFCADVPLQTPGEYAVEVVADSERGPEVAALFFSQVGDHAQRSPLPWFREVSTTAEARRALLARINALRAASAMRALAIDETLSRVAQKHAEKLGREGTLVHYTAEGRGITSRLRAISYGFDGVAENLAVASGPMAAHFALEHSPGHRQTLLDPRFDRIGIGVSWQKASDGARVVVTEVLVSSPRDLQVNINSARLPGPTEIAMSVPEISPDEDPAAALYQRIAARRAGLKLPPLRRSAALEAIARAHAESSNAQPTLASHDRVFASGAGEGAPMIASTSSAEVEALAILREPALASIGIAAVRARGAGPGERFVIVAAPRP